MNKDRLELLGVCSLIGAIPVCIATGQPTELSILEGIAWLVLLYYFLIATKGYKRHDMSRMSK